MSDVEITFTHEAISGDCEEAEREIKRLRAQLAAQTARMEAATAALDVLVFALDHQPWLKVIAAKVAAKELLAASQSATAADLSAFGIQVGIPMCSETDDPPAVDPSPHEHP